MKIGFIGAGKVGFSLGKFFSENNVRVTGYYSRNQGSTEEAASFTNSEAYYELKDIISDSDALFLTVPDSEINSVYEDIKAYNIVGKYLLHCSGAVSSTDVFGDIDKYGAFGLSIHPLFPFNDKYTAYRGLKDAFFCIEARERDVATLWEKELGLLGLKTKNIWGKNKAEYHLACVYASNLVCSLFELSRRHLENCGFSHEEIFKALTPLAKSNLENILSVGPHKALSGPVERGDKETVKKHLSLLSGREKDVYALLSITATELAKQKQGDNGNIQDIKDFLEKEVLQ